MILEAIVTSRNADGTTNISPMGPRVTHDMSKFELRPYNTSTTFANLRRNRCGVLHVTDDVELIARAAIGKLGERADLVQAKTIDCQVLSDSCRWYEFEVEFIEASGPRVSMNCRSIHSVRNRDFFGFNRGKHAVLEAAILATRIEFLPAEEISQQFLRLASAVTKTGGPQEQIAFDLLREFVNQKTT